MFHSDRPIDAAENDLLHRSGFAKLLARSLIDPNSPDTFTIGLFGKWGSGKTSIVNMTLNYIEESSKTMSPEDAPIVVHFEPWNFSNTDQLLTQFFIHLSNEFRSKDDEKSIKIGEALEKYADAFELAKAIPVVGGLVAYLGKKLAISLGKKLKNGYDEKDILKQKELVIELLQKQTNRLLIIIDDIDRLTNEQIRLVFQLITSVANFPNTTYLVVFDKEIVVNALKTVQGCNGEDYLKKIIQVPIQIPDMQGYELRTVFITQLNKLISDNEDVMVSPEYWQNLFDPCIDPFIKNLRDVNRLCNAVQFKLAAIAAEVNFTDMVAISAIELFRPPIYEWIKSNKDLLTGQIISIHPEENNKDELYERYKQSIRLSLKHYKFDTSDEDLEIILIFLSYLFPYFGNKIGKTYNSLDARCV